MTEFSARSSAVRRAAATSCAVVAVLLAWGCSFPWTPSARVLIPEGPNKIPLTAGLLIEQDFATAHYVSRDGDKPDDPLVRVKVGKSSATLFQEGLPRIFERVVQADAATQDPRYDLLVIPELEYSADRRSGTPHATVEYRLQLMDPRGERAGVSSGPAHGRHPPMTFGEFMLIVLLFPIYVFVGPGTYTAWQYADAFGQAEAQAFQQLEARLRNATMVVRTLVQKERAQELARIAPGQKSLNEQLAVLVRDLMAEVPPQPPRLIAVTSFSRLNGEPATFEVFVQEEVVSQLVLAKPHSVVERALLQKVLQELRLNQSDLVDPKHAKVLGKLTGADAVLVGSTADLDPWIKITARLVDTETGAVLGAGSVNIFKDRQVRGLLKER